MNIIIVRHTAFEHEPKIVAAVQGSLEDAYALTQNIENSWAEEPREGVTPFVTRARSTSVGDQMFWRDAAGPHMAKVTAYGFNQIF